MQDKAINKTEIKEIIKDEINKFYDKEFANKLKELLNKPGSPARKEMVELIKKALFSVHKFMYIRKDVWGNDIK